METLKQALMSQNILAWVIVIVLFVLCLKFIKSAGKGILIFIGIMILCAILGKYFPGFVAPMVDFVQGGWLGENRP
ncbi:Unannotated [Lentimonas sp. CC4]|nr:Unannotated [Lentimonas sp. CC4]CAA6686769.1 Unannotated [Lentimonas sp. CC6]CAA7075653.1 Unannotated [Lentimonas sp. CC4]CAA7168188.1 Unannotated [Lentimonas sp. CC21]CAA7181660.1 Unannotated [Lentimonas sp. CC8]